MTINKLTDERVDELARGRTGLSQHIASHDESMAMAQELQEYRKAENKALPNTEQIYQCEFCHHDDNGDLQWHWEDVNKDFYEQYDSGRRGKRRVLYKSSD